MQQYDVCYGVWLTNVPKKFDLGDKSSILIDQNRGVFLLVIYYLLAVFKNCKMNDIKNELADVCLEQIIRMGDVSTRDNVSLLFLLSYI